MNVACVLSSNEKARKRRSLVRRDGGSCHYCKEEMILPAENGKFTGMSLDLEREPRLATLDHKIPRARGGRNELSNLVLCCNQCNNLKKDMTEEEFRNVAS